MLDDGAYAALCLATVLILRHAGQTLPRVFGVWRTWPTRDLEDHLEAPQRHNVVSSFPAVVLATSLSVLGSLPSSRRCCRYRGSLRHVSRWSFFALGDTATERTFAARFSHAVDPCLLLLRRVPGELLEVRELAVWKGRAAARPLRDVAFWQLCGAPSFLPSLRASSTRLSRS